MDKFGLLERGSEVNWSHLKPSGFDYRGNPASYASDSSSQFNVQGLEDEDNVINLLSSVNIF